MPLKPVFDNSASYHGANNERRDVGLLVRGPPRSSQVPQYNIPTDSFLRTADDLNFGETDDGNGNVTETGGKTFSYDSQNELDSANGGAVTVMYDGFGNRISKTANGVTTKYLVDDLNPTAYPQVFDELTGSTVTRTYTYGVQRISENQVIDNVWTPS